MMIMSELPEDLVEEILSRVPATSLKRLRSTCKRWNALFKNVRFTEKHFLKAPKQSLFLISNDYKVCLLRVSLNVAPSIYFKCALSIKDFHTTSPVDIATVFHCDGLLLCTTKDKRLVVCNPCLGENRWIPFRTDGHYAMDFIFSGSTDTSFSTTKLALGYQTNKSCRSYKILRWSNRYTPNCHVVGYEIYELSSDSWRILDNVTLDCTLKTNTNTGVSLKGNTYWLIFNNWNSLSSFDFSTERFTRLCLPPNLNMCHMVLSVVRDEQLSMLHQNIFSSTLEIWMTNAIGTVADLLWKKSFIVDLRIRSLYMPPACMSYLIVEEKKLAVFCNVRECSHETSRDLVTIVGEDVEYYVKIPDAESTIWRYAFIFNYVPSLVHIYQGIEAKDKKETSRQN